MFHLKNIQGEWKEEGLAPFSELMMTWNAKRPLNGKYLFYAGVITDKWSPWLLYASWGSDGQASCNNTVEVASVKVYQDAFEVLGEQKATGFQIKVATEGDASLDQIYGLHVYTNSEKPQESISSFLPVCLEVKGLSQMTLDHVRHKHLCSATSTMAVVRYLSKNGEIDPVSFAQKVWDGGFDIFGNWVFSVAQAATELGPSWDCWVERLGGFEEIYRRLQSGTPVVVSVRSPLPGSAQTYPKGHLIAVIGFEPKEKKVVCMDPAFPTDDQTRAYYHLSDFLEAWERRGRISYVFSKRASVST